MTKPLSHVFTGIVLKSSRLLFVKLVVLGIPLIVALGYLENQLPALSLESTGLPGWIMEWPAVGDIADMELVGDPQASDLMADGGEWADHRGTVVAITFLDFVFIYVYSLTLALALTGVSVYIRKHWDRTSRLLAAASWLPFLAGALDAVENAALLSVIAGRNLWLADLSRWCAAVKFLILAGLLAALFASIVPAAVTAWKNWVAKKSSIEQVGSGEQAAQLATSPAVEY